MPSKALLVDKVKSLQRSSADARTSWCDYVDAECNGVRDPNRHDAATLQAFINYMETGAGEDVAAQPPAAAAPAAVTTVVAEKSPADFVRIGSRLSKDFKVAWMAHCKADGKDSTDPAKCDDAYLAGFAVYIAGLIQSDIQAKGSKRKASADGAGAQGKAARNAASTKDSSTGEKKTTASIKKSVAAEIRRLNAEGGLLAEIRLGKVAGPLSQVDEATALEILASLDAPEQDIEDPTEFICNQVGLVNRA